MSESEKRTYFVKDVARFRKTSEEFGGLSNMAPGFPLIILEHRVLTSEALYQACRFPHLPDVQAMIITEKSPMTAKMRSKPYRKDSRPDWDEVRVAVMKWCLRVKLIQNWQKFSDLLLSTGDLPIVEESRRDSYWGAILQDDHTLDGQNVLGRLLMDLRGKLREEPDALRSVRPPAIDNFCLMGKPVSVVGPFVQDLDISVYQDAKAPAQLAFL